MGDYDICPDCEYEAARCACPKGFPERTEKQKEQALALFESVMDAIRERREDKPLR